MVNCTEDGSQSLSPHCVNVVIQSKVEYDIKFIEVSHSTNEEARIIYKFSETENSDLQLMGSVK